MLRAHFDRGPAGLSVRPRRGFLDVFACAAVALALTPGPRVGAQSLALVLGGDVHGAQFGRVVAVLPDLDGDGVADLAVGSPLLAGPLGPNTGRVELRSGASGSLLQSLLASHGGERFGSALAVGDLNGDGGAELVVGAPLYSLGAGGLGAGRVEVFDLSTGTSVHVLTGTSPGGRFGDALAWIRDQNGDGLAELAVGSPLFSGVAGLSAGRVQVFADLTGVLLFERQGAAAGDRLGAALAALGDTNLDFREDLAVGSPLHDGPGGVDSGRVDIFSWTGATLASATGGAAGDRFGTAVARAGDLDGDGRADLFVGSPFATASGLASAGRVTAFDGSSFDDLWTALGTAPGGNLGASLAYVGDTDGDGVAEVAVGEPLVDLLGLQDAGRARLLDGATGASILVHEGSVAFGQNGFAVAGGDFDRDGRPDLLSGAPFEPSLLDQRGTLTVVTRQLALGKIVAGFAAGPQPRRLAVFDVDGDGDRDVLVLRASPAEVRILWNGTHDSAGPFFDPGTLDALPITVIPLAGAAEAVAIAAWNVDGDAPAELLVGRSNGTISAIQGLGLPAAPTFAAEPAPIVADERPDAGPVSDLTAILDGGTPRWAAALAGTLANPGRLVFVDDPFGTPSVGPILSEGGSFVRVVAADLDGSGAVDLVAANASFGPSGGIHNFLAPTFSTGPRGMVSGIAVGLAVGSLDGDSLRNDVFTGTVGFAATGGRVLRNFDAFNGFSSSAAATTGPQVRAIAFGLIEDGSPAVAALDGLGRLVISSQWTGSAFDLETSFPAGQDLADVWAGPFTGINDRVGCVREEVLVVSPADGVVRVLRDGILGFAQPIPGTGCPPESPTALSRIAGTPVLGDAAFALTLSGATPLSSTQAFVQLNLLPGSPPFVVYPSPACGFALANPFLPPLDPSFTVPFTLGTDAAGFSVLPIPLPNAPELSCIEAVVQWIVFDGGPLFGLTLSDALLIRLGESL